MSQPNEPRLFPELESQIFQLAFQNSPQGRLNLMVVSQRVTQWVLPLAYRYIVIDNNRTRGPPFSSLQRHGHHVQSVLVVSHSEPRIPPDTILKICPNLRYLALWGQVQLTRLVFKQQQLTRLFTRKIEFFEPYYQSLISTAPSVAPSSSIPVAKIQPFFSNVTHLGFYDPLIIHTTPNNAIPTAIGILRTFTSLTHLLLYSHTDETACRVVLGHLPNLIVLVYLFCGYTNDSRTFESGDFGDPRVVMMDGHFTLDWQRGMRGEMDIWQLADQIIAKRGNASKEDKEDIRKEDEYATDEDEDSDA